MYEIFGRYGSIRQIRLGNVDQKTKGTAFVIYDELDAAKSAMAALSGFNVGGRYLIVLYYQPAKMLEQMNLEKEKAELADLRKQYGLDEAAAAEPAST